MEGRKINKIKNNSAPDKDKSGGILAAVFISAFVSCVFYLLFFRFSGFIWSFNVHYVPFDTYYVEWVRGWMEPRNGLQVYFLYGIMLINAALSFALIYIYNGIKNAKLRNILLFVFFAAACLYFAAVGFSPPERQMTAIKSITFYDFLLYLVVFAVPVGLNSIALKSRLAESIMDITVILALVPVCFVASGPFSLSDYEYILNPALKMLKGFKLSGIYFQYDFLLSLIAAFWMKLGMNYFDLQKLGQFSVYLLFAGSYIFSKRFFHDKKLPAFLLLSMVILRFYAFWADPQALFQATPLRLDLWFIAMLLAYYRGIFSFSLAAYLAFLIFFAKAFGIIYLLSYVEVICVLIAIDVTDNSLKSGFNPETLKNAFFKYLKLNWKNFFVIIASYLLGSFVFGKAGLEAAGIYTKAGRGFLPIDRHSFYWFMPVIFGSLVYLLYSMRKIIPEKYFNTAFFLVFLSIGSSIYYFSRSQDYNIIAISAVLLWVFFVLLDVVFLKLENKRATPRYRLALKVITWAVPIIFLGLAATYYSGRILKKAGLQISAIKRHEYTIGGKQEVDLSAVSWLTNNSKNVYFLCNTRGFLYYFYGNYDPIGYYEPFNAWLYKKDMTVFLDSLLNKGYYLIVDEKKAIGNLLDVFSNDEHAEKNNILCVYRKSAVNGAAQK